MLIIPPNEHTAWLGCATAGILATIVLGAVGIQGAMVMGVQGMGVKTPKAAAVAAATAGFAKLMHIPKGMMFIKGLESIMLPAGGFAMTLDVGKNTRELGATPKLHMARAPVTTIWGIYSIPFNWSMASCISLDGSAASCSPMGLPSGS